MRVGGSACGGDGWGPHVGVGTRAGGGATVWGSHVSSRRGQSGFGCMGPRHALRCACVAGTDRHLSLPCIRHTHSRISTPVSKTIIHPYSLKNPILPINLEIHNV